jgi:ubiquinone/menaquinone biosynthesis C-methylase UbiE
VLDAGCGTGAVLFALHEAIAARGLVHGPFHGFDITPAMLDLLHVSLKSHGIEDVELVQADVLALGALPAAWRNYDLIVSASMLEYVPRQQLVAALGGLRALLGENGSLLLFITRDSWLMRPLVGRLWQSNLYRAQALEEAFVVAGYSAIAFRSFPPLYRYLALWGHAIEARR